jgi:hypothetical protein
MRRPRQPASLHISTILGRYRGILTPISAQYAFARESVSTGAGLLVSLLANELRAGSTPAVLVAVTANQCTACYAGHSGQFLVNCLNLLEQARGLGPCGADVKCCDRDVRAVAPWSL